MADGKSRDQWNHTASLMALIANCHRDPKKGRLLKATDFHPQPRTAPPQQRPMADITLLKQIFVDRGT